MTSLLASSAAIMFPVLFRFCECRLDVGMDPLVRRFEVAERRGVTETLLSDAFVIPLAEATVHMVDRDRGRFIGFRTLAKRHVTVLFIDDVVKLDERGKAAILGIADLLDGAPGRVSQLDKALIELFHAV